jgi:hypothetical protein
MPRFLAKLTSDHLSLSRLARRIPQKNQKARKGITDLFAACSRREVSSALKIFENLDGCERIDFGVTPFNSLPENLPTDFHGVDFTAGSEREVFCPSIKLP